MATMESFGDMVNEKTEEPKKKKPLKSLKELKDRAKEMGVESGAHVAKDKEAY